MPVQVVITVRHGTIQPSVHAHIEERSRKLLTFFDRVTAINVTVSFEGHRATAELLVDAEHKHNFVATVTGDDVTGVFDAAIQKMEQQLRKYKEQLQDHRHTPPMNEVPELMAKHSESQPE